MVTWSGSDSGSGIDYYEAQIDGGTWINKGTGTSHTFTGLIDGAHTVNVRAWDNAGNDATDSTTFTVDTSIVVGTKYAVLAGISNYKAISDLSYCDEDVNDWYNYLVTIGYESNNIIVLGDHTSSYEKYDGTATESNIKYYINWLKFSSLPQAMAEEMATENHSIVLGTAGQAKMAKTVTYTITNLKPCLMVLSQIKCLYSWITATQVV
ncbi:MAG: Ig-like domain-containing protein [Candidatus Heimdallarchaeota archaeon]